MPAHEVAPIAVSRESASRTATCHGRVLVVDDERDIVRFIGRALRAHGFHADEACNAYDALELATTRSYGLVLLDLLMPGLDGIATLSALMTASPRQPVLVLSALTDVETKVRCLELGAADYLMKPFALAELLARVRRRLVEPTEPLHDRFMRVKGLTLDLERHAADAGDGVVKLSEREFDLLLHLMRRAGTVCTREELLAEVWRMSFDPGTNVVDVYVRRLRHKLGREVVQTLRSVGYTLGRCA
jgi:DNA-binding response OmpR family regulator